MRRIAIVGLMLMGTIGAYAEAYHVYVGTYTRGDSEGIYVLDFDSETGDLINLRLAGKTENPSFLALHPTLPMLYSAGEMSNGGTVSAFSITPETGALTLVNQQSSKGGGPCHVAVSPDGKSVATANYGGGSVAVLPADEHGALGEAYAFFQHEGTGPNERRQEKAHAHAVNYTADGRHLLAADLGMDKVVVYACSDGGVVPNDPPHATLAPGAGPRHMALHPTQPFMYVVNELDSTVTTFAVEDGGVFTSLQSVSTLPNTFTQENTTAEIFVHPSGKFVYASNRGHDSIAEFRINEDGTLTSIGHTKTGGKQPRNFNISPDGNFIIAANQRTENVTVLKVDPTFGHLTPTGVQLNIPAPVCIVFAKPY